MARCDLTALRRRLAACSCSRASATTLSWCTWAWAYLSDALSPLTTAQNGPRDTAGVLALQEEGLGLAVLETEDLAVTTDEELALYNYPSAWHPPTTKSSQAVYVRRAMCARPIPRICHLVHLLRKS